MISIKKYLDMKAEPAPAPALAQSGQAEPTDLFPVLLASYRAALRGMGKSGARVCPAPGAQLEQDLARVDAALGGKMTAAEALETGSRVESHLRQWSERAAEYFKAKADDARELLLLVARTAESLGTRDQRYAAHFTRMRKQLQTVANLEDLALVRAALVREASGLKNYIEQMEKEGRESVAQLQAEVSNYEHRLRAAEEMASRDGLTGLPNRRSLEGRIQERTSLKHPFCLAILDLNEFKRVNDQHGHLIGDLLLKQFAQELRSNLRATDLVGRWGGDEFVLVFDSDLAGARAQIERIEKWAFGQYTLPLVDGKASIKVADVAAIGLVQCAPGEAVSTLIGRADAAMYADKKRRRLQS